MSLVLRNIHHCYPGASTGLSDISFEVNTGELVAVIGPSGSGKSTLLKLVAGLADGHSGSILLGGEDLAGRPVHQRHVGVVFQHYALFPHLNVLDNIAYGLKLRKVSKAQRHATAHTLLDTVGLAAYAHRSVDQLSGGQQQRVALARALAIQPKALLLDEPMGALDASIRGHLRDQIRQIQRRFNTTTLLVTHDQEEALTMADRVAVLFDGKLLQLATPQTLYEAPACRTVAAFVGQSTIFPATVLAQDRIDLGFCILATSTGSRALGTAVCAMVRPENVQPDPSEDCPNRLPGHPGMQRFYGASVRYDFHPQGGDKPLLAESRAVARASVGIAPEHIRLLDH